jgi:hypothetical protein
MADITKIAASLATPNLSSALQQAPQLPIGQAIEAKITQILADGVIRLISSFGTFELQASHPALQPGVSVRLNISAGGSITLTVLSARSDSTPSASQPPQTLEEFAQESPAVITTLSEAASAASHTTSAPVYTDKGQLLQPPGALSQLTQNTQNVQLAQNESVQAQSSSGQEPFAFTGQAAQAGSSPTPSIPSALAADLSEALAKQGSLAPLISNLAAVASLTKSLPQPLRTAIEQALKSLQPLSQEATAQNIEQAIKTSGVFQESNLLRDFNLSGSIAPAPDLKAALLQLQNALTALRTEDPLPGKSDENEIVRLFPPQNNEIPRPQAQRQATLSSQSSVTDIINVLAKQTDAALARVRVLQFASLPLAGGNPSSRANELQTRPGQQVWHADIPFLVNGQASIVPLKIEREAEKHDASGGRRSWRVRFALQLAELGPVHALLALGGGMINVTLWAERDETYALLSKMARDLHYALLGEDLDVAEIEFRPGNPREQAKHAGSHLDTRT